ncbi:MAG: sigma-54-dependent Fis family transcriptional regulator, partial [Chlamydiia bacterium]|nr:sigma-54-dependent Fis family transcriptional regulator [Chlamydiia bacterium]
MERVLVVDDDPLTRDFITESLEMRELTVYTASCGKDALAILKEQSIDLLVTDMHMPHMSGLELIEKMRKVSPATLVIVITAYGSIDNAVDAMRLGAFNYILKPFTADTVSAFLEKADEHFSLVQENIYLKESLYPNSSKEERALIGESAVMKEIIATCKKVAESNASVFIHGESGTGKEVIAQLIHSFSPRADNPFIKVNCAAIAETLIESEFFGHEKGAFTGANAKRAGRFELASGGTLLLDEISEIPPALQAKLLRVTQEMEFE